MGMAAAGKMIELISSSIVSSVPQPPATSSQRLRTLAHLPPRALRTYWISTES